jgi:hypothetical protein
MGVEGSTGVCRPLHMLGTMSRGDPLNRSFLQRRFIGSYNLSRRSSGSIPLRVLIVAIKETKRRNLTKVKRKEASTK